MAGIVGDSTITNFTNKGTHRKHNKALGINTLVQETLSNSGFIKKENDGSAIAIENNATLGTLNNTGTIEAKDTNNNYDVNAIIAKSFNNNGLIKGGGGVNINNNSTIQSFSNSWAIKTGNIIFESDNNLHAGVKLNGGTIENIINTGIIRGNNFGFAASIGKFGKFSMQDDAVVIGKYSGIIVGNNQTLGELEIRGLVGMIIVFG